MSWHFAVIATLSCSSLYLLYDNLSLRSEKGLVEAELSQCQLDASEDIESIERNRLSKRQKKNVMNSAH